MTRPPMRYDLALWCKMIAAGLPLVGVAIAIAWVREMPRTLMLTLIGLATLAFVLAIAATLRSALKPLRTLASLIGGLRRGDYSMRSARARADDALGVAMLEANALADTLTEQRIAALEATALLRKVMAEIDVAVFAFDEDARLRLVNRAGEAWLARPRERIDREHASELGLAPMLDGPSPRIVELSFPGANGRAELRRSVFRQNGRRHTLLVLADVSRALRQEELAAWRSLVRVLSHEINNSLTPIASVAGSMQRLLDRTPRPVDFDEDLRRALALIEGRADALGRFMGAYARLARLPPPQLRTIEIGPLLTRIVALESRVSIELEAGPAISIDGDPDQLEQLFINLLGNAVDAVVGTGGRVSVSWTREGRQAVVHVRDEGPGLAETANLFVPFFSTKPNGSGIGLALSRQIVESHGGSITLNNRVDREGAEASVRLPLR